MPFPSREQAFVIDSDVPRIVVVAAPGTGKTKTIVERMIRLLREDPQRVISLVTFTRTSRRDTDRRLRETVGEKAVDIAEENFPRISTLHAFAKALVHRYASFFGRDSNFGMLVARREPGVVVSDVVEDMGLRIAPANLQQAFTEYRSAGNWPTDLPLSEGQREAALHAFESYLRFYNSFDIEGLVSAACLVLGKAGADVPPILLQVDEYQDLNLRDQELVRLASGSEGSRVVVVGDDAQSIYGWRHARPGGIRELWESRDWKSVKFPECHRLPAHVLRAAHRLVRARHYLGCDIVVPEDDGRRLPTLQCTTSDVQIKAVGKEILRLCNEGSTSDGTPLTYRDFMVLCPSNNHASQAANGLLDIYGMPVRHTRPSAIPDDIWKLLLVLRMLGQSDSLALRQWLTEAGLPRRRIRDIRREAIEAKQSLFDYSVGLTDERITSLFETLEALSDSLVDPERFAQTISEFPHIPDTAEMRVTVNEIAEYAPAVGPMILRIYEKFGILDAAEDAQDVADEDAVLVTTMHSAKGMSPFVAEIEEHLEIRRVTAADLSSRRWRVGHPARSSRKGSIRSRPILDASARGSVLVCPSLYHIVLPCCGKTVKEARV